MTKGEQVVKVAESYLWVVETSRNSGPKIDEWSRRWGMGRGTAVGPQPWCGIAVDAWFAEAGVNDYNICHPSTAEICNRARRAGYVWNGRGKIPVGALWVKDGVHVALVTHDYGNGNVRTIDGNSGGRVRYNTRSARGSGIYIIIIPGIAESDYKIVTDYYVQDIQEPSVYRVANGKVPQWKTRRPAEKAVEEMKKRSQWKARNPRVVRTGKGTYAIGLGVKDYGPYKTQAVQVKQYKALKARLGRELRRYSVKRKVKK